MGANDRTLNVVGESYMNLDGSSRQNEILCCWPGEPVTLRREPDNPHDEDAVAVDSCRGIQLGYLSRQHAPWIGGKIDNGNHVIAIVERVVGGLPGERFHGIQIRVNCEGEEPDQPSGTRQALLAAVAKPAAATPPAEPEPAQQQRGWLARLFGR